jgi:hypothetical protein
MTAVSQQEARAECRWRSGRVPPAVGQRALPGSHSSSAFWLRSKAGTTIGSAPGCKLVAAAQPTVGGYDGSFLISGATDRQF